MGWSSFCLVLACLATGLKAGSAACAPCHTEIYRAWQSSSMARSSGRTGDGRERFSSAAFQASGASYRVSPDLAVAFEHDGVRGRFPMQWFIGSGRLGRSYAGLLDGFVVQSPASYFSAREAWDLSPGYATKGFVDIARPIEQPCLQCHATGARLVPGTENRYEEPLFTEGGVGCERCHGSAEAHLRQPEQVKPVNPAKLAPERRDSVCLQCHLTGAQRIAKAGRGPATYQPGDRLSDHLIVFLQDRASSERAATDHAEQLSRSRCQQASGAKLWCGTCHEPHAATTRANACQSCHPKQHPNGGADCVACHMPKAPSREGQHIAYTDHTIARRPASRPRGSGALRPFPGMQPSEREWAIAERRRPLLEKLAQQPDADAAVLVQLAQLQDANGQGAALYERALKLEPGHPTALANLAIYRMRAGRPAEALKMWADAFERYPSMLSVGLNLAVGRAQAGDREGARVALRRVLRFHPDSEQARRLMTELR